MKKPFRGGKNRKRKQQKTEQARKELERNTGLIRAARANIIFEREMRKRDAAELAGLLRKLNEVDWARKGFELEAQERLVMHKSINGVPMP